MSDLWGGSALGAAFGVLLQAVIHVTRTTARFPTALNQLKRTLTSIQPIFDEIEKLNNLLEVQLEETDLFVDRLRDGLNLVRKCSKIHCCNVYKRYVLSKKLRQLDNSLVRFFQVDVTAMVSRDSRKILVGVNSMDGKVDKVLSIIRNGGGGGFGAPFMGSCGVPGLPNFLVGLDVPLKELKATLLRDDVQVVVLSAPGGCGKTTLAKQLCHDDDIKGHFGDKIFFVTVSKTPNLCDIVQKIFRHIGYRDHVFHSEEDAKNQLELLMRQLEPDPILLVLDDVWSGSESMVEDFVLQIPGFKLLVTSRFVLPRFDPTYKLKLLDEDDSMTLFYHSVFPRGGSSYIPEDLMKEIVKICGGFPLALVVVGGSLKGKPEVEWIKRRDEGRSILASNNALLASLQTSLDAIDSRNFVKDCYLDLGSFPEDQRIPATVLMDLWIELYNLDEKGVCTVTNLFDLSTRNLVNLVLSRNNSSEIEGYCNEHFVTLHDLLRELAIYQSNREPVEQRKRLIMDINENKLPSWWIDQTQQTICARLLSISTDEVFSSRWFNMQLPGVEALILNFRTRNYTLPQFMESMNRLKVVIMTNYGSYHSELNNLMMFGHLSNLKRIRFEHVSISSLSPSMSQLRNLRKISLNTCLIGNAFENCAADFQIMWPNLEEINIDYCDDLVEFPSGLCKIISLKKISISYCPELVLLPEELGELENLEMLKLHSCTKLSELPDSVCGLKKLRCLDVSDCLSLRQLPMEVGEMSGLRKLNMRGCHGVSELPPSVMDLVELENVVSGEEIAYLWEIYKGYLVNLKIDVSEEDINLNWLRGLHR